MNWDSFSIYDCSVLAFSWFQQVFGFAGKCIKKAGGHLVGDDNNEKKK